ncbi:hypothetical protein LJR230_002195 [Trinickia sp. LjRoot230]|uniref:hypothetical protein n=1 Tax=Trinickia sp. LjRoot230 TaxID=3342288 RepID=UPI003ECE73BE
MDTNRLPDDRALPAGYESDLPASSTASNEPTPAQRKENADHSQQSLGFASGQLAALIEKKVKPFIRNFTHLPGDELRSRQRTAPLETRTLYQSGDIDGRLFEPPSDRGGSAFLESLRLAFASDEAELSGPDTAPSAGLFDVASYERKSAQAQNVARKLAEQEKTLFGRTHRLEAMANHGTPEDLSLVYIALFRHPDHLMTAETLEAITIGGSLNMRAAALLALGQSLSETASTTRQKPDFKPLMRQLSFPDVRPEAIDAIFSVYAAQARIGDGLDWSSIRTLLYRWKDALSFQTAANNLTSLCRTCADIALEVPAEFLAGLSNEVEDHQIAALGRSLTRIVNQVPDRTDWVTDPPAPASTSLPGARPSARSRKITSLIAIRNDKARRAAYGKLAQQHAMRISAGELAAEEWETGLWYRDVLPSAAPLGLSVDDLKQRYRATQSSKTAFAFNARFGAYLVKNFEMTPEWRQFLASDNFLNGPLLEIALRNQLRAKMPSWSGSGGEKLVLSMPWQVVDKEAPNVLMADDFASLDTPLWPSPMLFAEGSLDARANFILVQPPISDIASEEIDGQPELTAPAGYVLRDWKWHLTAFIDRSIAFDYVINPLPSSPQHRTSRAEALDPPLPEMGLLAIPHMASSDIVVNKGLALGQIARDLSSIDEDVIPPTLWLWTARESLQDGARNFRSELVTASTNGSTGKFSSLQLDGLSRAKGVKEITQFMQRFGITHFVFKPTDELGGKGVWMQRVDAPDASPTVEKLPRTEETPKQIATQAWELLSENRSGVLQAMVESIPLIIDGEVKGWDVRAYVARDANGKTSFSGCFARIADRWKRTNLSQGAKAMPIEQVIQLLTEQLGQDNPALTAELLSLENSLAQRSLAIVNSTVDASDRAGVAKNGEDMTAFVGIDFIVTLAKEADSPPGGKRIKFPAIEENGARSGGMGSIEEALRDLPDDHELREKYRSSNGGFALLEGYTNAIVSRAVENRRHRIDKRGGNRAEKDQ